MFHPGKDDEELGSPEGADVLVPSDVAFAPVVRGCEPVDSEKIPTDVLVGLNVAEIAPVGKGVMFPCSTPEVVEFKATLSPVDVRSDVGAGAGPGELVTRDTGNEGEPAVAVLFDG